MDKAEARVVLKEILGKGLLTIKSFSIHENPFQGSFIKIRASPENLRSDIDSVLVKHGLTMEAAKDSVFVFSVNHRK